MSTTCGRDGDCPWPSGLNPKDRNPDWPPLGYETREMKVGCIRVKVFHVTRETNPRHEKDGWQWYVFFAPPGKNNYDTPQHDLRLYQDPVKAQTVALKWARSALITTFAKLKKGATWKEMVDRPGTNLHMWRAVKDER